MKASHPILIIQEKGAFLGQGKALIFIIEPLKLKNQLIEERFFKCQIGSYPFPDNQPELVTIKKEVPYGNKMLKIRVTSEEGDNVNVNLPINLVKVVLKVGTNIAEKIPEEEKYVKDINVDLLIEAIENELDGQIVDITSANGDKVFVVIE